MGDPGPQALLRLLHRHGARLGEAWTRGQALRLLVSGFPKSATWVAEGGGRRLPEAERLLVTARRAEEGRNPWEIADAWRAYARHLLRGALPTLGSGEALRIALVLRRPDSHLDTLSGAVPSRDPDDLAPELARLVEASLDHDPDDRDSYERLIRYHLRGKDLKSVRRMLERGLQRFPTGVGLLTATLDVALAGDSFKKAARHAREILKLDPINTGAQERLVKAHLAHARKQMRAGRLDLARKELDLAADWDPGGRLCERRDLLDGLLELAQDPGRGEAALRRAGPCPGGGMAAAFVLTLECAALGRPAAGVIKAVGLGRVPVPSQADLPDMLGRLRTDLDASDGLPADFRRLFEKTLSAAAHSLLPQAEAEAACAGPGLPRPGPPSPRRPSSAGRVHLSASCTPSRPATRTAAGTPGARELQHLDDALVAARAAGDRHAAHRADEVLRRYTPFRYAPSRFDGVYEDDDVDLHQFGIDPNEALRGFVEAMGLDQLLSNIGAGPKDRAKLKQLEREVGREGVMEILLAMLRSSLPDFGPPVPGLPHGPVPPRPGGAGGKAKRKPRTDDDDPEQFDLFLSEPPMSDPYLILGMTPDGDDAAVRAAYLAAVAACPPERDPGRFEAVRAAYEALGT